MNRRTAIATIGAVTVSSFAGCLGESGKIEHVKTTGQFDRYSPVYGPVTERRIDFEIEIPPESRGSIELVLTRTSLIQFRIDDVSGSGTLFLFTEGEHELFEEGQSADGYSFTGDHYTNGDWFEIDYKRQVLVASNFGREKTDAEKTFEGIVSLNEMLPSSHQFNYPVVD